MICAVSIFGAAARGLLGGLSGKSPGEVAREEAARDRAKKVARMPGMAELIAAVSSRQAGFDRRTQRQIARGEKIRTGPQLFAATFGGQLAIIKFFENNDSRRVDIFYGGAGNDPLNTPDNDYHGHIVFKGGELESWLEPGVRDKRNRLY